MVINTRRNMAANEVTDERVWSGRRNVLRLMGAAAGLGMAAPILGRQDAADPASGLIATPYESLTQYNNYYEFGWEKSAPAKLSSIMKTDGWTVSIMGLCEKPSQFGLDDLLKRFPQTERIYRFRCVEGWSAVVPWSGFPLKDLLNAVQPLSSARYVRFIAVTQPETMPMQREHKLLQWPYVEGLQMNEAMHPLTLMATGLYGRMLPKQNGAPIRLVVPWKYGFKSIKAVVRIELLATAPLSSWQQAAPSEYGFLANVNPEVPHPRWSQATERPLSDAFFSPRRKTELFNGYGEEVASLYQGVDLREHF